MCCLPNKFPLPIFLIINKCDKIERKKRQSWIEKIQTENYITENQFLSHSFVSALEPCSEVRESLGSEFSVGTVDVDSPFREMLRIILSFNDIKERLLGIAPKAGKKSKKKEQYESQIEHEKEKSKCFIL